MVDLFYVNGCSHTAGAEMEHVNSSATEYDKYHCFSGHLHRRHFKEAEYINEAYSGNSNDVVALTTINTLLTKLKQGIDPKNMFVIIGFTDPIRYQFDTDIPNMIGGASRDTIRIFPLADKNKIVMPHYDELTNGLKYLGCNDSQLYKLFIHDYLPLYYFLENNNISYLFFHAVWSFFKRRVPTYYNELYENYFNNDKFLFKAKSDKDNPEDWRSTSLIEILKDKGYDGIVDGRKNHYLEDGHIEWANILEVEMRNRNII